MSMGVESDNSANVSKEISAALAKGLESIGYTAERYAKALCPVKTGRLRNSITHSVQGMDVYIGTNVEYGPYVELGGSGKHKGANDGRGFLRPAATEHGAEYRAILESQMKNS